MNDNWEEQLYKKIESSLKFHQLRFSSDKPNINKNEVFNCYSSCHDRDDIPARDTPRVKSATSKHCTNFPINQLKMSSKKCAELSVKAPLPQDSCQILTPMLNTQQLLPPKIGLQVCSRLWTKRFVENISLGDVRN